MIALLASAWVCWLVMGCLLIVWDNQTLLQRHLEGATIRVARSSAHLNNICSISRQLIGSVDGEQHAWIVLQATPPRQRRPGWAGTDPSPGRGWCAPQRSDPGDADAESCPCRRGSARSQL